MSNRRPVVVLAFFAGKACNDSSRYAKNVLAILALTCAGLGQTVQMKDVPVTVVAGESWLHHLHRSFDETSMGKTGRLGPPTVVPTPVASPASVRSVSGSRAAALHGSDLYRLNCRGCHGEAGLGAPPEIRPVIDPVRATSVALVMERMRKVGMAMSPSEAAELARQSRTSLLHRLHNGGQDMPAFSHLNEAEIRALVAYLKQLAGVPGAEAEQALVRESNVRIGEHIVKSTCHICHDAAGENPTPLQLQEGAVPPLGTLTSRTTRAEFVRKVTRGAPVTMGDPPEICRGRMPVFYYLTEEEAADVYEYLAAYPPYEWATLEPQLAAASSVDPPTDPPSAKVVDTSFVTSSEPVLVVEPSGDTDAEVIGLLLVVGVFATLLLAGGFGFTVREFGRLSEQGQTRSRVRDADLDGFEESVEKRQDHPSLVA